MPANQYQRALAAHPDVVAYALGPDHLASFPGVPTALLQEAINLRLFRGLIGREPVRAELDWMLSTWAGDPNVTRFLIACFGTDQYQARGTTPRHDVEFLGSGLAGVALERDHVDRLVDDIAPRWVPAGFQLITRMVLPPGARILQEYGNHWQLVEWGGQRRFFNSWHGLYRVTVAPPPGYVQILPFPNADWTVIQADGSGWEVVRDASGNTFTWAAWHGFLQDVPEATAHWRQGIPYNVGLPGDVIPIDYDERSDRDVFITERGDLHILAPSQGQSLVIGNDVFAPGLYEPLDAAVLQGAIDAAERLLREQSDRQGVRETLEAAQEAQFSEYLRGHSQPRLTPEQFREWLRRHGLSPLDLLPRKDATGDPIPFGNMFMPLDTGKHLLNELAPGFGDFFYGPLTPPPPPSDPKPETPDDEGRIGGGNGFIEWDREKKTLRWETAGPFWSYPGIDWIAAWNLPVPGTNHQGRTVKDELRRYYAELIGPQGSDVACGDDAIIYMYNRMDRATFWGLRIKMCPAAPENWRKPPEANYQQGMKTLPWAETNPFVDPAAGGSPVLYMEVFGGAGAENLPAPVPGIPG